MLQPAVAIAAFRAASAAFVETVGAVRDWDAPSGIGEWTVRELAGHTLRAFTTIETYLAADPPDMPPLPSATEYYRIALAAPSIHEGVAARGREAGAGLTDPVRQVEETTVRVLALVESAPADTVVNVFAGQMAFSDYLATRTVEVTLHTLDLQRAAGLEPAMPERATSLCTDVLLPLVGPIDLLLAITGRKNLNVLG